MDAIRGMFAKTNDQTGLDLRVMKHKHRLIIPANYVLSLKDGKNASGFSTYSQ